jgi:DNA-binding beta-propeller fold protein YncE
MSPDPSPSPDPTAEPTSTPTASPAPTPAPTPVVPASDTLRLRRLPVIRGYISPKSVVATQTGLVFAQNMMYRHTMTVYNRSGRLVKTISDRVILSKYGHAAWPMAVSGSPVEAAVAPDGRHIYVTQYSMYGPGFYHPGWDTGWVDDVIDRSFVYEIDTTTLRVTRIIRVGPVPKAVGVSPDGKWLLVGNWTHRDLSLVNLRTGREVKRIVVGGNPRGIAFAPDSSVVYLTAESGQRLMEYTFATGRLRTIIALLPGEPRHLVIDPTGRYLYASLNKGGQVVKIDIRLRRVVDRATTGTNPRTIALAPDGRSLYVVNYESQTIAKVRTRDMLVIQRLTTAGVHPVGLTYENATRTIWVSCYRGTIERFADR